MCSACVGGGLPVLEFGKECAKAEPVDRIQGVVNATTNYILSEMEKGVRYGEALKRAQGLGYAEPDPSFDVDGLDSACKIVILANHVMGTEFRLKDVKPLKGIRGVTQAVVDKAKRDGRALRLVATAARSPRVSPVEVGERSPLAAKGRSHAVVFHCRYSGERTIMGSGAGSVTTSLGVLRDLISLAEGTVA
jgi:homoserine dehydrogenase